MITITLVFAYVMYDKKDTDYEEGIRNNNDGSN